MVQFHRNVPVVQRNEALRVMREEQGVIMVATDAAARGLDVPNITHVVQAGFATNAVDFLHRVIVIASLSCCRTPCSSK